MKTNVPQTDYTAMTNGFQLVMPLDCEVNIEKNAPVRLLNAIMERMDYSKLYAAYMRNGQLKPGYNVNVATCSEFIIGSYISSDRSDMHTLIPFMEQLRKDYKGKNISSVVVDSGYESEENYCWFEAHPETELYVKPSNHEVAKHKKYRTDIRILKFSPGKETKMTMTSGKESNKFIHSEIFLFCKPNFGFSYSR